MLLFIFISFVGSDASRGRPFYWAADKLDRYIFNEHFYKNYEGISEDRLHVLGDEIFDKIIKPSIYPGAASLIARSKEQGHRQIQLIFAFGGIPITPQSGVKVYKLIYETVDAQGLRTQASGALCLPDSRPAGGLPLVSYQHGTVTEREDVYFPVYLYNDVAVDIRIPRAVAALPLSVDDGGNVLGIAYFEQLCCRLPFFATLIVSWY